MHLSAHLLKGDVTQGDSQPFLAQHCQHFNVGTMLELFETMLEHCVALKIVLCNIILSRSLMNLLWVHLQVLHRMHLAIS